MSQITIASYTDLASAQLAKSILKSANIMSALDNEYLVGINWIYSNAVGGVNLLVEKDDAADALSILQESMAENVNTKDTLLTNQEEDCEEISVCCPVCACCQINYTHFGRAFMLLSILLGIPLPFSFRLATCKNCKHKWKSAY